MSVVVSNRGQLRMLGWIALGFVPIWIASVAYVATHQGADQHRGALYGLFGGLCTYPIALIVVPFFAWFTGTWTVDETEISWSPIWRRTRRLKWTQIDRVKWSFATARLRGKTDGGDVSIPVLFNSFEKPDANALRESLERALSSKFDLSLPSPAPLSAREKWRSLARIASASAVLIAFIYGVHEFFLSYPAVFTDKPTIRALAMLAVIGPISLFFLVREVRRPNYVGRWRSRVSSAGRTV